jgi:uncharacterized protein
VAVTEALVTRAEALAWEHALRGYDAVQLASAVSWQESLGTDVVLATFDTHLWKAAQRAGLHAWPTDLADRNHDRPDAERTEADTGDE